jgi:predicted  nucleic acid-binding Zn-ribbon protein
VKEKIIAALSEPTVVRKKVAAIRTATKPIVNPTEIEETVADIKQKMKNIYRLAEGATDDETIAHLTERMNELEIQKRETEKLLFVLEDDQEERAEIEKELAKFEEWAAKVQPFLTDREYMSKAMYAELRLAIKILGIRVTVFPLHGNYPYRHQIDVTVPEVLAKMHIVSLSSH